MEDGSIANEALVGHGAPKRANGHEKTWKITSRAENRRIDWRTQGLR